MQPDYAKAFRIIRAAFGLNQSDLAARMGIDASHLSLIESGNRQPSLRVLNALGRALGVPTALVSLLASTEQDMEAHKGIGDLAGALLKLLVAAKEPPQRELKLVNSAK